MPRGAASKRAKVSNAKANRENREISKLHEKVAVRAYQLFENRDRADGKDRSLFRTQKEQSLKQKKKRRLQISRVDFFHELGFCAIMKDHVLGT